VLLLWLLLQLLQLGQGCSNSMFQCQHWHLSACPYYLSHCLAEVMQLVSCSTCRTQMFRRGLGSRCSRCMKPQIMLILGLCQPLYHMLLCLNPQPQSWRHLH
jgi:hypothetical protein